MWIRVCRYKNAGVAGYAEAFIPVQSDSQASEWYSYFENDVLVFSDELFAATPFSQPALLFCKQQRPILLLLLTGIILQASSCQSKKSTKRPDDMASVRSDSFFDQNTIPISVQKLFQMPDTLL